MSLTRLLRKVASVESLTEHGLDNGLPTDVQSLSLTIQLLKHRCSEIYIHSLDWPDNGELIREMR
jgi:hypothetical protein